MELCLVEVWLRWVGSCVGLFFFWVLLIFGGWVGLGGDMVLVFFVYIVGFCVVVGGRGVFWGFLGS